ncbi:tryptophan biosynthesis modulator TrpM [Streptomyces sp. NPDC005551]|uniref:tryptophan biosynthesis modulator TrpM n=1 Tax=Streptomyces sp. NPDC005551 TaxID=3364725 RepID=UPI00367BF0A8
MAGPTAPRHRVSLRSPGAAGCLRSAAPLPAARTARDPYARLARGCRPRGCRAPARRVHGRRVRYVIGDEPGQVNGMRWRVRVRALTPAPARSALRVV